MNFEKIIGEWTNSKNITHGIQSFIFRAKDGNLEIELFGSESSFQPGSWGNHTLSTYSSSGNTQFSAFHSSIKIADHKIEIAGNINKGLIIIASYIKNEGSTQKSNDFIREFFYHNN